MNAGPFYSHESDDRIMLKKDRVELSGWIEHLNQISEEIEYLLEIEEQIIHDSGLFSKLQELRRKNTLRAADLYRYELRIMKSIECDDMECDAYYLHNHERHRNEFINLLRDYWIVKKKILTKILLQQGHK